MPHAKKQNAFLARNHKEFLLLLEYQWDVDEVDRQFGLDANLYYTLH